MNLLVRICVIFLCGAAAVAAQDLSSDTWKKTNETNDDIVIYARLAPNSGIKELKANCVMEASPLDVWKAVMDKDPTRILQNTSLLIRSSGPIMKIYGTIISSWPLPCSPSVIIPCATRAIKTRERCITGSCGGRPRISGLH